jgi:hypothetical protein
MPQYLSFATLSQNIFSYHYTIQRNFYKKCEHFPRHINELYENYFSLENTFYTNCIIHPSMDITLLQGNRHRCESSCLNEKIEGQQKYEQKMPTELNSLFMPAGRVS